MDGRKLYRSERSKMVCGVCGGVGEYFNIDPTLIRLAWVFVSLWMGWDFWHISSQQSSYQRNHVCRKR